jgi:hypothetical protein
MPNKPLNQLLDADRWIRRLSPNKGMTATNREAQIRVTLIRGFELFNTHPYHNYETWSDGYLVEAFRAGEPIAAVEAEDLDDALKKLAVKLGEQGQT